MNNRSGFLHQLTGIYSAGPLAAVALLASTFLAAGQLVWNGGGSTMQGTAQDGSGSWDETTADWDQFSDTSIPWTDGDVAYIGQGGTAGTITVNAAVKVGDIYFEPVASGSYNLAPDANGDPLTFVNGAQVQVSPGLTASISCPLAGNFDFGGGGTMTINVTAQGPNTSNVELDRGTLVVNGGATHNYGLGTVTCDGGILMVSDNLGGAGTESVSNAFLQGGVVASAPTGGSVGSIEGFNMYFQPGGSNAFGYLQIDGNDNLLYASLYFDLDLATTNSTTGTAGANCANDYVNFSGSPTGAPNSMGFFLHFIGPQPSSGTVMTYTVLNYTGPTSSAPATVTLTGGASVTSAVLNPGNPATITVTFGAPPSIGITCSTNVTIPDDGTGTGAVVNYQTVTASGGCSVPTVTESQQSGTRFPDGTTTVNCAAYDTCDDTNTCSFTVTVTPAVVPPPPPLISAFYNSGNGSVTIYFNATGGATYDLQYATSLVNPVWTTIPGDTINQVTSGPQSYTDPNAGANAAATGQIYYRIKSP